MKKVAVVGSTGYTGVELLRLLVNHPDRGKHLPGFGTSAIAGQAFGCSVGD